MITDEGPGGLPIRHYLPPDAPQSIHAALRETPAMLRFYTELLGPYPFEAYGVAVIDDPQVQIGLEAQTLTILPINRVAGEQLHELVHQWFGDSVTPATWQDTWLNEGFATYAEWLWVEATEGEAAFERLLRTQYASMVRTQMGAPAAAGAGPALWRTDLCTRRLEPARPAPPYRRRRLLRPAA